MNVIKRAKIWAKVLHALFVTFPGVPTEILGPEETVDCLKKGKSLIRFGDGEFGIFEGKDIHYQPWSEALQKEFAYIKQDYEKDPGAAPYLLAVPKGFMTVSGFKLMKKRVYVSSWAQARLQFKKTFRRDIPYGDAFLFAKENFPCYSRLWSGETAEETVIFVHNRQEFAERFSATYGKKTFYIPCPAQNAYGDIDRLEQEILSCLRREELDAKDVCVVLSAGPAGKVLVYRLSQKGWHAIDAGHCWDDPLEGIET